MTIQLDLAAVLLCGLGGFWLLCAPWFGAQMWRGVSAPIQRLHRDLAPDAGAAAWWAKNLALAAVGALWIAAAIDRALLPVAIGAIVVEQAAMPVLSPRHWASWTGVGVGLALAGALALLDGVTVSVALDRVLVVLAALAAASFAGALALIAVAVPAERVATFVPGAERLMPWLGRAALGLVALATAARWIARGAVPPALAVALVAMLAVIAVSMLVNLPINRRLRDADATARLALGRRWLRGHLARTGASAIALCALALELS